MSDKKYTPGPWSHIIESDEPDAPNAVKCGDYYLASIYDSGADSEEQASANAALMSCAPELLEALEELVNHLKDGCYCG